MSPLKTENGAEDKSNFRPLEYFKIARANFNRAKENEGEVIDQYYEVGGYNILLQFAGRTLVTPTTLALSHLRTAPTPKKSLTIYLWDSKSSGISMPTPPWHSDDYSPREEIKYNNNARIHTVFQIDSNILSIIDMKENVAIFWAADASRIAYYEMAYPLRTILHLWLSNHQRQIMHAAAVGTREGAVLLVGKGGSGKSSSSLACLDAGLLYLGDDYSLISTEKTPEVFSLYCVAKLKPDNLQRFTHLKQNIINDDGALDEKALLYLYDNYERQFTSNLPIKAILLPRITGLSASKFSKTTPAMALRELAPSTIFQLPGAGEQAFRTMANLVTKVQSYQLELGTNLSTIPEVITQLLTENINVR